MRCINFATAPACTAKVSRHRLVQLGGGSRHMRKWWLLAGGTAMLVAAAAIARSITPTAPPAALQSLLACRSIADSGQRLACYDRAAQGFAEAVTKRELV